MDEEDEDESSGGERQEKDGVDVWSKHSRASGPRGPNVGRPLLHTPDPTRRKRSYLSNPLPRQT